MARVAGKIALVTGAASRPGLGSAAAERLAEEGAATFVTDVDLAGAEALAADIRAAGGQAVALAHDVASAADWDRVFAAILDAHGRLDILVNNAGIALMRKIELQTMEDWRRQIDVNLTSVYLGTQRAVAAMRRSGGGSIVNLSSAAALVGVPDCSAYSASKGGVRFYSKSIAMEVARDRIRVNTVHPGVIRTNMQKVAIADIPEEFDRLSASIPIGFIGEPSDIANAVLYLASDEARYVTGTELVVDGGLTAQ